MPLRESTCGKAGRRFSLGTADARGTRNLEIIGVASLGFLVRLDTIARRSEMTRVVRAMAPGAMVQVTSLDEAYADIDGDARIAAAATAGFGALAFVVAVAGVYGVTAFIAAGRRREFGIRLALGATASDIRRSVLWPALRVVGIGIGAGLAAALLASAWIERQPLFVTGSGPATYVSIAVVVAATALLATLLPTRRATRVNPAITLRAE